MPFRLARVFHCLVLTALLIGLAQSLRAQPTGLLYDPEPPSDSAYVRILLASRGAPVDVLVDGRVRVHKLGPGRASDYLVLTAGKHQLAIHPTGKSVAQVSTTLDVVQGRAMTVAFTTLSANATPILFEDKANSNKLKALLAVYHLDAKAGVLDVLTVDGKTQVFSGLAYGTSRAIPVNAISIELMATKTGDKRALASTALAMAQGGTYSVLLLPAAAGDKLQALAQQNKIERYTGK